jgi:SWI/SNF-related matrix-associated actin-dependent regulator 1 of chromatin subfamily A
LLQLFDHQVDGATFLAGNPRGYLADTPGLGKTLTAVEALKWRKATRPLVLAPAVARQHWRDTFEQADFKGEPTVLSYDEFIRRQIGEPDALILDEAHMLRTMTAKRTKLVLGAAGLVRALPPGVPVWPLSGTPMWKHPGNLWTIMAGLYPRILADAGITTYEQWLDNFTRWFRHRKFGIVVQGAKNTDRLNAIMGKFMLRRTLDDVGLSLPPIFWQPLEVEGTNPGLTDDSPEARAVLAWLDGAAPAPEEAQVSKLRRLLGLAKAPAVGDLLADQLEGSDEKIVVFAHHRAVMDALQDKLRGFGVARIDGSTPDAVRTEQVQQFQRGKPRVFLGQNIACQVSLTLTAARRAVIVEPDCTANVNYQLAKRIARIGQSADRVIVQFGPEATASRRLPSRPTRRRRRRGPTSPPRPPKRSARFPGSST